MRVSQEVRWAVGLLAASIAASFSCGARAGTLHVTASATGSGDGSQASPFTLAQAVAAAAAGDTVILAIGDYNVSTGLNFNKDGTAGSPIVWQGTLAPADFTAERADGTQSTLVRNVSSSSNGTIDMSGSYNEFRGIVFQQDYGTPNGSDGRELISISGDHITWDGCAFKHPTNASSSSNHSIRTSGDPDFLTFRNSHFYRGSRTIIWIEGGTTSAPDDFLMEGCTLKGADNHPSIQIMPYTNLVDPVPINGAVLRNNLWIDNSYSGAIYLRHNSNFKIYNNVFVRSQTPVDMAVHPVAPLKTTGPGLIAHNTVIHDGNEYFLYNEATTDLTVKNNLLVSLGAFYANYAIRFACPAGATNSPSTGHAWDYNLYYVDPDPDFSEPRFVFPSSASCGSTSTLTMSAWQGLGFDTHALYGTGKRPTFVNEAQDDYRLQAGSVGVAAGAPIAGITTDFDGKQRDPASPSLGAFEYTPPCTDGAIRGCYSGPAGTRGVGRCSDGVQTCASTSWGACSGDVLPVTELCTDGVDNDCDGTIDGADIDCACTVGESRSCYEGPAATLDVGTCRGGQQDCATGRWGSCAGQITPLEELCADGLDNDCDGSIDPPSCVVAPVDPAKTSGGCGCHLSGGPELELGGLMFLFGLVALLRPRAGRG